MKNIGNLPCNSLHLCFKWNRKSPLSDGVYASTVRISNSSRVGSAALWRCHRPAHWPAVLQTAWSLGAPCPLVDPAGRTPLWTPPRIRAAVWTKHTCPADLRCRRTPPAGPTGGCSDAESTGLIHGGCTARRDSKKWHVSDVFCISSSSII